ncbi:MAG: selenium-dependent xanthine dehydrogenase [Candidatus Sumerlaeaceae bacterium]|nr:selenium-dependent xanthine dehydrogenase [Candidatus Sumerlaeaceae bacterium]
MSTTLERPVAGAAPTDVSFNLNGQAVTASVDSEKTLLEMLRDDFNLTSPKNGCAPQANCGCCAVMVDGKAMLSCALKAGKVAGRSVVTLEGVPEEDRQLVAEAFTRSGGLQCGFCIPGMAVRGLSLIQQNPNPSREEIADSLKQHLCRCTGYVKIIDSIDMMARAKRGEALPEADESGKVGSRLDRYRGQEFVLGDWKYVDDIKVDGMVYAAMRFSDHPRAKLKGIDAAPALAVPGVHRVVTAADIPGERYVGLIKKDWPIMVAIGEETRYVGDVIAMVVADDQRTARKAAALINVDYEVLKPITSPEEGLAPYAPQIHPTGNLLSKSSVKRGDVEAELKKSAHVVEGTYQTQFIEHMFLEPEACVAVPEQDNGAPMKLRVFSQGQGVYDDRRQISSILNWDKDRVYVQLVSNGGAFGGKEDMSIQGQTALAAALLGQPVKCTLTREESMRVHPKRHPIKMHVKIGADAEGKLTGIWARMIGDKGAYASVGAKVLERAAGHATGPYRFTSVDVESLAVYTNNTPCGAMRGFGANQAAFAIEALLNKIAKLVGVDGWEIRWRNALRQGDTFCTGQVLDKPIGLEKTLLAVKDKFRAAKYAGIACGIKNTGIGNGMPDEGKASITVEAPDRLMIRTGFTEMGQGLFTICIQTACEETGLPPGIFRAGTDTSMEHDCGQTTASRATVLGAEAVMNAARRLKADLEAGLMLSELVGKVYPGEVRFAYTNKPEAKVENPKTHITYGYATQVVILDDDGRVAKVIAAHDVGRVMNPTLLEGQMDGSIHMGLGYALSEEFVMKDGHIVTGKIKDLGVLRAHHMPEVETIFIEEPDPETAYGTRGVGEIGLVPTAPAVAAALEAYDGIHRTTLPMKDSEAARAIIDPRWKPGKGKA